VTRDADLLVPVAVGGVLGAWARYAIAVGVPHDDPGSWPWATFVTNVVGAFVLGVLLVVVLRRLSAFGAEESLWVRWARPFAITGVLGGFTTFSALAVETRGMAAAGHAAEALGYAVGSTVCGVLAVLVGMRIAGALVPELPGHEHGGDPARRERAEDEA
jgi:CrcB protein